MSLIRPHTVTPAQLRANRENAKKSTGPRTEAGKRRAALNSLKRHLVPAARAYWLSLAGGDPREYRRLHRDLISLFRPQNAFLRGLVADLAEVWWSKVRWLRRDRQFPGDERVILQLDRAIEYSLITVLSGLSLWSHKWNDSLVKNLGSPISSPQALRRKIEARLGAFQAPSSHHADG